MKISIYILALLAFSINIQAQKEKALLFLDSLNSITKPKEKIEYTVVNEDIYNPINFTAILERMPNTNGGARNKVHPFNLRASKDYIQKGAQLVLSFNKTYIDNLDSLLLDLRALAYIQRKDKTIKPLSVKSFVEIEATGEDNINYIMKPRPITDTTARKVNYEYTINETKTVNPYSGEIELAWEDISVDDKIVILVNNRKRNNIGFTMVLVYDDFGWKQSPIGGFSFIKILQKDLNQFITAANVGYSFRYQPRKSTNFWAHFSSPAFGPILHVFQYNDKTTIGAGAFISSIYNTINLSGGYTITGEYYGKFYFAIGFNFIEGYNRLTNLVK